MGITPAAMVLVVIGIVIYGTACETEFTFECLIRSYETRIYTLSSPKKFLSRLLLSYCLNYVIVIS